MPWMNAGFLDFIRANPRPILLFSRKSCDYWLTGRPRRQPMNSTIGTWQQQAMNVQLEVTGNQGFLRPFSLKLSTVRPKANNGLQNNKIKDETAKVSKTCVVYFGVIKDL